MRSEVGRVRKAYMRIYIYIMYEAMLNEHIFKSPCHLYRYYPLPDT